MFFTLNCHTPALKRQEVCGADSDCDLMAKYEHDIQGSTLKELEQTSTECKIKLNPVYNLT